MTAAGSLSYETYLGHIEREVTDIGELLDHREVAADAPVPGCPGWGAADLRNHCAEVLVFWHRQLLTADPDATEPTFGPDDGARTELTLAQLAEELVADLRAAGEQHRCWNWSGRELTARWVARRMAQEFGVHRADAQATRGEAVVIDFDLAADGIDELVDVFYDAPGTISSDGVLALVSSNRQTWRLAVDADEGVVRTDDPADMTVIGEPDQLLLFLWNRQAVVTADGDPSVLAAWRTLTSAS